MYVRHDLAIAHRPTAINSHVPSAYQPRLHQSSTYPPANPDQYQPTPDYYQAQMADQVICFRCGQASHVSSGCAQYAGFPYRDGRGDWRGHSRG